VDLTASYAPSTNELITMLREMTDDQKQAVIMKWLGTKTKPVKLDKKLPDFER
jgi:hypothetical protein